MDYGGVEKRRTKKDLKRKRISRGYKKGGQFRSIQKDSSSSSDIEQGSLKKRKDKKRKN